MVEVKRVNFVREEEERRKEEIQKEQSSFIRPSNLLEQGLRSFNLDVIETLPSFQTLEIFLLSFHRLSSAFSVREASSLLRPTAVLSLSSTKAPHSLSEESLLRSYSLSSFNGNTKHLQ